MELEALLKYVSADNPGVERIIITALFLVGLWWIVRQFTKILKMHMDQMEQCNEASQKLSDAVTQNTVQTARVADAVNQLSLRMPNYGCSLYNNQHNPQEKPKEEVNTGV